MAASVSRRTESAKRKSRRARRTRPDRDAVSTSQVALVRAATSESGSLSAGSALAVQRTLGNQALLRLIDSRAKAGGLLQRVGPIISSPTKAGKSAHPTLKKGAANNAEAVMEAQQKLCTSPGGPTDLAASGTFDDATEKAVKAFQNKNKLTESGEVDAATWVQLDAQGKSSVGRVERPWEQTLMGTVQGMTSKYSYKIDASKITVTVGISFVADKAHPPKDLNAVVAKWKTRILARWNLFKAEKDDGKESRDIVFEIVDTGGNTVNVIDKDVGSDAGNWSVPDNENDNGPAHEFGHMIGLADEYKQTMEEYKRLHPGISEKDLKAAKGKSFGGDQYTDTESMMGMGALKKHSDKTADPEPRHVREFVGFVEKFCGGKWEAKKK